MILMNRKLTTTIDLHKSLNSSDQLPTLDNIILMIIPQEPAERTGSTSGMLRGVGLRKVLNCGACKESTEHVLFVCVPYNSQRQNFGLSRSSSYSGHISTFQGVQVNYECSSRYASKL